MKDIKSTLDFLLTREKDKPLQSKVDVKFDRDDNYKNVTGSINTALLADYMFKYELKPRQDFLYMDIINWFRNESTYDEFAYWLEQVKNQFAENMAYITELDNYTASFQENNSPAKIIYLATKEQSHLIFYSETTVPVKITYSFETEKTSYTIYSEDVFERIAHKSYILNIIDQISYDNLTRVTAPFEKDIHFNKHNKAILGLGSRRILRGNMDALTNYILKHLDAEECELKIESKINTTLNEIDRSTVLEILSYYLSRYLGEFESNDVLFKMNYDLCDIEGPNLKSTVYSYGTTGGYAHDIIEINIGRDLKTKNINKFIFTFEKRGKQDIDSSLTFEELDNKLVITLHDKKPQKDIDLLYKLVGRPLELKEQNDIQNYKSGNTNTGATSTHTSMWKKGR